MSAYKETIALDLANLTLAAYTHFGARGLKGVETYHIVNEAWKRGILRRVIAVSKKRCQFDFDLALIGTLPGESRIISGLLRVKDRLWEAFPSRFLGETIFDRYASSMLSKPGGILITTPGMIHTARKAKALGYTTVFYGGIPDPRCLSEHIQAEKDALGLKAIGPNRERSWVMSRVAAHVGISDYIIAISEFAKESYAQHGFPEDRIFVAHLGVELERFSTTDPPSDGWLTYLFVGHVNETTGPIKGLQYLLKAWSELDFKKARLVVCGKMGEEAKELIKRYDGTLKNVDFTGYVPDPAAYFQTASVLVFPSVVEGFGKVVLEAMASGRPVIATPIPRPIIREGIDGFYIRPRSVQDIKERMRYFYDHPSEVVRMGANASEQAQKFTWERFSQQIADIVEEISAQPRR